MNAAFFVREYVGDYGQAFTLFLNNFRLVVEGVKEGFS
jgi:hypothetical protein